MTDQTKDGGPAFPRLNPNYDGNWDKKPQRGGMTLRDWFAGQALANPRTHLDTPDATPDDIAGQAYGLADAMLAAREDKP